jgi:hypothetical protein
MHVQGSVYGAHSESSLGHDPQDMFLFMIWGQSICEEAIIRRILPMSREPTNHIQVCHVPQTRSKLLLRALFLV